LAVKGALLDGFVPLRPQGTLMVWTSGNRGSKP
jgi:hypothetical protein